MKNDKINNHSEPNTNSATNGAISSLIYLWANRYKILFSVFLGAIISFVVLFFFPQKLSYVSTIPVIIDNSSLPAITDGPKIVEQFKGFISDPSEIIKMIEGLDNSDPIHGCFSSYFFGSVLRVPDRSPNHFLNLAWIGGRTFKISLLLNCKDGDWDPSNLLMDAVNLLVRSHNESALLQYNEMNSYMLRRFRKAYDGYSDESKRPLLDSFSNLNNEISKLKTTYIRLLKMAPTSLISFIHKHSFTYISDPDKNHYFDDVKSAFKEIDRILYATSALYDANLLKKNAMDAINEKLVEIRWKLWFHEKEISSQYSILSQLETDMSRIQREITLEIDRASQFLPQFTYFKGDARQKASASLTSSVVKTGNPPSLVVIAGSLSGLLLSILVLLTIRLCTVSLNERKMFTLSAETVQDKILDDRCC